MQGIDLDAALSAGERADAEALTALVHLRLQDALLYSLWLEEANYKLCQGVYAAAMPFPLNRILAYLAHKRVEARFQADEVDALHVRAEVYRQAQAAYQALATRLGEQRYFFGDRPSSVDAAVAAHLLFLDKAPLVSKRRPHSVKFVTQGLLKSAHTLLSHVPDRERHSRGDATLLSAC